MTSEKPETTVEATVAGHEMWKGKPLTKLDIPAWSSQYPIPLYGIKPEHQAQLPIGQTLKVVLTQDNQKNDTDGSQPWHFFWSFARLAGAEAEAPIGWPTPSRPAAPAPAPVATTAAAGGATAPRWEALSGLKDVAIRRAVALKAAVDHAALDKNASVALVLEIADSFAEWLAGPVATMKENITVQPEPAAPAAAAPSAAPPAAPVEEAPPDPDFDAVPSAVNAHIERARAILRGLDSRGEDYRVDKKLFDTMMDERLIDVGSIKTALAGQTPAQWLKANPQLAYRDMARAVCEWVISGE